MKKNKSRYAILGMVFDKPSSGYEIRKMMMQSTDHFWQESDASIYPMLKKLEAEGKVESKSEYVGKRERKIFEITASGKKEFDAWMSLPAESDKHRDELLLKLFFGANAKSKNVVKHLYEKLQKSLETKKRYKHIERNIFTEISDKNQHKSFWEMTLRNGMMHNAAELQWIQECINILEKK